MQFQFKGEDEFAINIYDYIGLLTLLAKSEPELVEMNKDTENEIKNYAFLAKEYKADNAYSALKILSERKIPTNIIELWIDEGMVHNENILIAVENGYPELSAKIDEKMKRDK
jgi:hypothetical protein